METRGFPWKWLVVGGYSPLVFIIWKKETCRPISQPQPAQLVPPGSVPNLLTLFSGPLKSLFSEFLVRQTFPLCEQRLPSVSQRPPQERAQAWGSGLYVGQGSHFSCPRRPHLHVALLLNAVCCFRSLFQGFRSLSSSPWQGGPVMGHGCPRSWMLETCIQGHRCWRLVQLCPWTRLKGTQCF